MQKFLLKFFFSKAAYSPCRFQKYNRFLEKPEVDWLSFFQTMQYLNTEQYEIYTEGNIWDYQMVNDFLAYKITDVEFAESARWSHMMD